MANYRLGLDVGSNSIGWCAVALDDENRPTRVLQAGVRTLSSGDEAGRNPKSGASLAANRQAARAQRRRRDRFVRRQRRLMDALVEAGLMPKLSEQRKSLEALDPYWLRKAALHERLEPCEIGRALFHINQRRGFKSNRIADARSDEKGATKQGIAELTAGIAKTGARTLGEFLADRHGRNKQGHRLDRDGAPRPVRFRPTAQGSRNLYEMYPTRELVADEIHKILKAQQQHHPDLLTDALRNRIERIVIEQRPLKKQIVGRCTLRPEEGIVRPYGFEIDRGERAPKAHPLFQRFRILQDVSHLRVGVPGRWERPLTPAERTAIAAALTERSGTVVQFKILRKAIRLPDDERFNFERSGRKGLTPDSTGAKLGSRKAFGARWRAFGLERKIEIVERLLAVEDKEELRQWLRDEFDVRDEAAEYISELRLPQGHCHLGRAMLSDLVDVMAKESSEEADPETGELHERALTYDEAVGRTGRSHSDFRREGRGGRLPYYGEILGRHVISRPDAPENSQELIGKVSNPTVHIGLNQLRKVVNALIEIHGAPYEIVIELARELKMNKEKKDRIHRENIENEKNNAKIREDLRKLGQGDNYENRMRLRLYNELPADMRVCAYTGAPLSMQMLFSDGVVEIDHILPYSRTLDDSFMNKVLCTREANRRKGNLAPENAWSGDRAREIAERAERLFPRKSWRFAPGAMKRFDEDGGLVARHLTDTQYLSRLAKTYLEHVCGRVFASPGRLTAMLRAKWGLNDLLPDHNYPNVNQPKNRKDHRHHTIDAFVLACTDRGLLNRIARESGRAEEMKLDRLFPRDSFPEPFEGYREDLDARLRKLVVSHRPDHGIAPGARNDIHVTSGALLDETAYGVVDEEIDGKRYNLVSRKPVKELKKGEIGRVRDAALRDELLGVVENAERKGVKLSEALAEFCAGRKPPVRHVRVLKTQTRQSIRVIEHGGGFRKAYAVGRNHRIEIYEMPDGAWRGEGVSVFDANRPGFEPAWREYHPSAKLVMKVHKGDMISADFGSGRGIYRVYRLEAGSNHLRLALHNESGSLDRRHDDEEDPFRYERKAYSRLKAAGARRVRVDPVGRVRPVTEGS